jgi:hypothetical protein
MYTDAQIYMTPRHQRITPHAGHLPGCTLGAT